MRNPGDAATQRLDSLTAHPARGVPRARHRRGWYTRRTLALADVAGLSLAFVLSAVAFETPVPATDEVGKGVEVCLFLLTLPLWVACAQALRLYDRDDARA